MPRHTNEIIVGRKMCAIEEKCNKVAFILNGKHNEIQQQGKKKKGGQSELFLWLKLALEKNQQSRKH